MSSSKTSHAADASQSDAVWFPSVSLPLPLL
jgi:hypothetical protein